MKLYKGTKLPDVGLDGKYWSWKYPYYMAGTFQIFIDKNGFYY